MLTQQEIQHLLNDVEYLPDWKVFIVPISSNFAYIQWAFREGDTRQWCRKWLIDLREATKADIIQTALLGVLQAAEHEVREKFTFKKRKLYGPHFDPDKLAEFSRYKANLSLNGDEDV